MLAVVSAVVAFDAWPGNKVSTHVQTLVLDENAPAIRVSAKATGPSAIPAAHNAAARAVAGAPRVTPGAGGLGGQRVAAAPRTGVAVPANPAPALPPAVSKPLQPVQDTATPIFNSISNPGTTAGQIADGTQAVTDAAGGGVGRVSPDVGNAVTAAGQTVAQTVRDVPVPGQVAPGQ
jgi:hypothetical protein